MRRGQITVELIYRPQTRAEKLALIGFKPGFFTSMCRERDLDERVSSLREETSKERLASY